MKPWYLYDICVPFGNPNYDVHLGGSHDMDVQTPPNTQVTALLSGEIVSITSPDWGKVIGVELDEAYNSIPYMAYLHLSAIQPGVVTGMHISVGDVIGYSGGCNTEEQYAGTSNPTSQNFLNLPESSSQPQTGIALMRGPFYGTGLGWSQFPPIDHTLDPTSLIWKARAAYATWNSLISAPFDTGIASSWRAMYHSGQLMPPPTRQEVSGYDWDGSAIQIQDFCCMRCEWREGVAHWYRY